MVYPINSDPENFSIQKETSLRPLTEEANKVLDKAKQTLNNTQSALSYLQLNRSKLAQLNRNLKAAIHSGESDGQTELLASQSAAISLAIARLDSAIRQIMVDSNDYS